jgi:hypothetical protein
MKLIQLNMVEGVQSDEDGIETEQTKPVVINADCIRAFYARRGGKPGTRLTFTDGGGFAVSETPDNVAAAVGDESLAAHLARRNVAQIS